MRSLKLAALLLVAIPARSQTPRSSASINPDSASCDAALDSMVATLRLDYPGYREKTRGREPELEALVDSIRAIARDADHYAVCIPALQRYTGFFRDPHIVGPWQAAPPTLQSPALSVAADTRPDPNQPTISFVDDSTVVLRLPDFDLRYQSTIDNIVAANQQALRTTPNVIVDVRGNAGGCSCSYASLSRLLYTHPFSVAGSDVLASPANVAYYRDLLTSVLPENSKTPIRAALVRMEASPNELVELSPDRVVQFDTVFPMPRKVAVLVDRGCASSCEGFVFEARQSRKVSVLGLENTRGVADYGNVRGVLLPGWRRMRMPTSRSRGERIDYVGIPPAVRIPTGEGDLVEFARRYLAANR